ncbi:MAG: TadE/TadG family type IV pilus assembly protein [Egibacteraceae bacterium]
MTVRIRDDRGVISVEFTALLPFLLLAALFAWQVLLLAASVTAAENAARTGSRAETLSRDGADAAVAALPSWLRDAASADTGPMAACDDNDGDGGTKVAVCVPVPIVAPGLVTERLVVRRAAELPPPR